MVVEKPVKKLYRVEVSYVTYVASETLIAAERDGFAAIYDGADADCSTRADLVRREKEIPRYWRAKPPIFGATEPCAEVVERAREVYARAAQSA